MLERLYKVENHCFREDAQHIALDVRQSRIHAVSPLEREILTEPEGAPLGPLRARLGERFPDEEISSALERLMKRKLLLSNAAPPEKMGALVFPAITHLQLSAAHDCNLRCRYCIVDQGSFGGLRQRMSSEVARQGVDLLIRESGEATQCTLSFSGGEPLLNWSVVRDTITYCQEQAARHGKQVRYVIKTNGTLFDDESIAFIKEQKICIQLSLDGPPTVHDRMRASASGHGSHDMVMAGLAKLLPACAEQVTLRPTLTRFSPPLSQLLDYLNRFGTGNVGLARVIAQDEDYDFDQAARQRLKAEYTQVARRFLEGRLSGAAAQMIAGYTYYFRTGQPRRVGTAGGEYLVVSASGGVYPHPELVEQAGYCLGHVATGLDRDKLAWWRSYLDVDNRAVCRDCWARYACGGGCLAAAIKLRGTTDQPIEGECDLIRHLIQLAAWVHVTMRRRYLREIQEATRKLAEGS